MAKTNGNLKDRGCPACDYETGSSQGWKNGFELISCRMCGTLYVGLNPNANHELDYAAYYSSKNLTVPDCIITRLEEIVSGFSAYRKNNRLLDIGFGAAVLLQAAVRAGWIAEGIEISRPAVQHARRLGLAVSYGEIVEARYPDACFDIVVGSEMLEHLRNPQKVVREIARVLRPGGLFWATTPHGRGLSFYLLGLKWSAAAPPEHLQLFSLRGVKTLLASAGFPRIEVSAHGVNPYEILHALRRGCGMVPQGHDFKRVESSYRLNKYLMGSPSRLMLKSFLNRVLSAGLLGDSLKIRAER